MAIEIDRVFGASDLRRQVGSMVQSRTTRQYRMGERGDSIENNVEISGKIDRAAIAHGTSAIRNDAPTSKNTGPGMFIWLAPVGAGL